MIVKQVKIYCFAKRCPYLAFCDNQKQKGFCMRVECPFNARHYIEKGVKHQTNNRNDEIIKSLYEPDLRKLGIILP